MLVRILFNIVLEFENWRIYFHFFQNRKCRDVFCIVLYTLFVLVWIAIAVVAFRVGNWYDLAIHSNAKASRHIFSV